MSAAHTPGPWTLSRWDEYGDTRFYVAQADGAPYTPHYSDVATLIAETVSSERKAIQEANARLIAAAPDLFEIVAGLASLTEGLNNGNSSAEAEACRLAEKARALLAKALPVTTKDAA